MFERIHEEEDGNNEEGFKIPEIPKHQIHNEREFMDELDDKNSFIDPEVDFNDLTTDDVFVEDDAA